MGRQLSSATSPNGLAPPRSPHPPGGPSSPRGTRPASARDRASHGARFSPAPTGSPRAHRLAQIALQLQQAVFAGRPEHVEEPPDAAGVPVPPPEERDQRFEPVLS